MTTPNSPPTQDENVNTSTGQTRPLSITPELVKKVADKVFDLFMADLKTERERYRLASQKPHNSGGGRYAF